MTSMLLLRLACLACDGPTMRFEPAAAHATIPRLRPTHTYVTGGPARRRGGDGSRILPVLPALANRSSTRPRPGGNIAGRHWPRRHRDRGSGVWAGRLEAPRDVFRPAASHPAMASGGGRS